ncbi:MAG: LytR/AlgR family response regulator transcription factor [Lachnospira sp.]
MYKIAIIDDEIQYQDKIEVFVRFAFDILGEAAEVYVYSNGTELIKGCNEISFDIIFMDIYIGDENGFHLAATIQDIISETAKIVFITSDSCAVYDCFEYKPFDFIHKELLRIRIPKVINRIIKEDKQNFDFVFNYNGSKKVLKYSNILFLQSDDHYLNIYTEKYTYSIRRGLSEYQDEFLSHDFVKIHRKRIVNLRYIMSVDEYYDQVILKNGTKLELSRYLKKGVKQRFDAYCS